MAFQTKAASELKNLINREATREAHRKIRWVRKKITGLSTSCVIVPTASGGSKIVTDKQKLERCIIRENEKKYHQTDGKCPLMRGILHKHLGNTATTPEAKEILEGSYYRIPSFLPEAIKTFLRSCQTKNTTQSTSHNYFSIEHYRNAWKAAKESTGSGQVHFGHWKAGTSDDELIYLEWLLTIIPGKHGFSPRVWQCATDVMILKKQGVLDIDKLRTIVLYESDFNFYNKCVGPLQ